MQIYIIEALFEEYNRAKRLISTLKRGLENAGITVVMADLPGMGESLIDIASVRLADWHETIAQACARNRPDLIASFRGGALLDNAAFDIPKWRFSPETGARIVRDLRRAQLASPSGETALYAGHALSDAFLSEIEGLSVSTPSTATRTVRLNNDLAQADHRVLGTPLWRRAEPGEDSALAAALITDLTLWARQCAVS